jgi:drug/metabolite transporter (DMT)-like permease
MGREGFGIACIGLFTLSTAFRDVYLGGIFQAHSPFIVNLLAFGAATAVFGLWVVIRRPHEIRLMLAAPRDLALACGATSAAWLCYFQALAGLPPATVNTLHTGIGPLTILAFVLLGVRVPTAKPLSAWEAVAQAGVLAALAFMAGTAMAERPDSVWSEAASVGLAVASGVFIATHGVASRRLNERGVSPSSLMAVRFLPLLLVSVIVVALAPSTGQPVPLADYAQIAVIAAALIALPSFAQQVGTALAPLLTGRLIVALGPVLVLALQALEGRLVASGVGLLAMFLYAVAAAGAVLASEMTRRRGLIAQPA